MRKISSVLMLSILVFILVACSTSKKDTLAMKQTEPNTFGEKTSDIYTDQWVENIVNFPGVYEDLIQQHPTSCIQTFEQVRSVYYYSTTKVAELTFDKTGNKLLHRLHDLTKSKKAFDDLKLGQKLDNVQEIDPNGDYTFLYTGRKDTPRVSTHYTIDRHVVKISYDNENIITDINIISISTLAQGKTD